MKAPSSPDGVSDIGGQAWLRRGLRGMFADLQKRRQPKLGIDPQLESPPDSPKVAGMRRCLGSCSPQGSASSDNNRGADIRGSAKELAADGFDVDGTTHRRHDKTTCRIVSSSCLHSHRALSTKPLLERY
jgi:hypothetical protein